MSILLSLSGNRLVRRILPVFLVACSLVLAYFCYRPGLAGDFVFDDRVNIIDNASLRMQSFNWVSLKAAAFSMGNDIAARPVSMASFAIDEYLGGSAPYGFKLTNLIIHLLDGVCIYILTLLILGARNRDAVQLMSVERLRWTSVAVASAWLLHPLNLTGVLYVVQRMTSLAALFSLLGLIAYLFGRQKQIEGKQGWGWIFSAFFLFTPLAVLCKENGALLPAFMLLAEVALLNFQAPTTKTRRLLMALFAVTVILPAIVLIGYSIAKPAWLLVGYHIRDFTLAERLMTEARVLWFYLRMIIVPDISQMGLQHDDIAISRGLLAPYWTLIAAVGLAVLAGLAWLLRKRHPIATFGILFFLLGHSMESSVIALEIAHEHRNYLPIYGILLALFYYLLSPVWHKDTLKLRQALAVVLVLFFGAATAIRAQQWGDAFGLAQMEVKHHPDSVRANIGIAYIYASLPAFTFAQEGMNYEQAFSHYKKAAELSSTDMSGLFGMIGLNAGLGRPVDERWVQELEYGLEHQPFAPDYANSLMRLEKCQTQGVCGQLQQAVSRLLQAALRNPTLGGKGRTSVQFAWSNFLFVSMHERDAALRAAYKAVEATPDDQEAKITLIEFLINQGKPEEAMKQIALLRQSDDLKIYVARLDELQKLATMPSQTLR